MYGGGRCLFDTSRAPALGSVLADLEFGCRIVADRLPVRNSVQVGRNNTSVGVFWRALMEFRMVHESDRM